MGKRFSTLLISGKAASLPLMMQQAQAITPAYTDIVTTEVSQVQLPVVNQVQLNSLGSSTYNGSATLCADTTVPTSMSVVVTGLVDQDQVYVIASSNLGGNESLDSRLKIGTANLVIPIYTTVNAPGATKVAATYLMDFSTLKNAGIGFAKGGKFYMQTLVISPGAMVGGRIVWSAARISEVDEVSINNCSTYGTYGSY